MRQFYFGVPGEFDALLEHCFGVRAWRERCASVSVELFEAPLVVRLYVGLETDGVVTLLVEWTLVLVEEGV